MKTQIDIYRNIYNGKFKELIINGVPNDAPIYLASRKANIFAIQKTWEYYNKQFSTIR